MSFSLSDARYRLDRALGLLRRGMTSLRTRGWRATWQRVSGQLGIPVATRIELLQADTRPFAPFGIATSPDPLASIIIPVYGHFDHTLACLRAIAAHPPSVAFEIIVVDDASADGSLETLRMIDGLRLLERPSNGGFIATCNDGALVARGDYLVFLNNDTVPQPDWLDALLRTFSDHAGAGLAGSQLLYPDGRLQEAGGVVFNDGSCWNYGRFESPDDPRYTYVRDADYISGAAIALPRGLFHELGGFDTRYAPAYYEDTDLAFAVRASGKRVVYQPASRVVHDEGTTAGTSTASGPKSGQVRNQLIFAAHRAQALAQQPPAGSVPSPALLHAGQRQILVVDSYVPTPDRDSASLRLVNLMRMLRDEGAHVVFLPANPASAGVDTSRLQAMGIETWHAPHANHIPAWLRDNGARFSAVMVSRHYVARELLPQLRRHALQACIVFDSVDLHYLREMRAATLANDPSRVRESNRTRTLELDVVARSDITLVVSAHERELLIQDAPGAKVAVLSNLHAVAGVGWAFEQREDLVFVGGFRHPPNVDAMLWFVNDVFPLIRQRAPDMQFHCIGGDAPADIRALSQHAGVVIHGHVPDITPYMDRCRVAVAPLRFGAGVKGKINLSMAHGQPVVATSAAAEGMHLCDGHDILVADTPQAFADHVLNLYNDREMWMRLSKHGHDNISRHFSADAARGTVREVFFDQQA
ncbi:glycosyltransferase [Luteimonas sp. RIT-PG2_3]